MNRIKNKIIEDFWFLFDLIVTFGTMAFISPLFGFEYHLELSTCDNVTLPPIYYKIYNRNITQNRID